MYLLCCVFFKNTDNKRMLNFNFQNQNAILDRIKPLKHTQSIVKV